MLIGHSLSAPGLAELTRVGWLPAPANDDNDDTKFASGGLSNK